MLVADLGSLINCVVL